MELIYLLGLFDCVFCCAIERGGTTASGGKTQEGETETCC